MDVFLFLSFSFGLVKPNYDWLYGSQDIATRVIAEGLRPEQTIVSKIMTRNPIFVTSDSLAIEALQKMVQGNLLLYFQHFVSFCLILAEDVAGVGYLFIIFSYC